MKKSSTRKKFPLQIRMILIKKKKIPVHVRYFLFLISFNKNINSYTNNMKKMNNKKKKTEQKYYKIK